MSWKIYEFKSTSQSEIGEELLTFLVGKVDAFLSKSPGCYTRFEVTVNINSSPTNAIKWESIGTYQPAAGNQFILASSSGDIWYRGDVGQSFMKPEYTAIADYPYSLKLSVFETENVLLIPVRRDSVVNNIICLVRVGGGVLVYAKNSATDRILNISLVGRTDIICHTTTSGTLAPDEALLGQYFYNGSPVGVYDNTQSNMTHGTQYDIAGIGKCIKIIDKLVVI